MYYSIEQFKKSMFPKKHRKDRLNKLSPEKRLRLKIRKTITKTIREGLNEKQKTKKKQN